MVRALQDELQRVTFVFKKITYAYKLIHNYSYLNHVS